MNVERCSPLAHTLRPSYLRRRPSTLTGAQSDQPKAPRVTAIRRSRHNWPFPESRDRTLSGKFTSGQLVDMKTGVKDQ